MTACTFAVSSYFAAGPRPPIGRRALLLDQPPRSEAAWRETVRFVATGPNAEAQVNRRVVQMVKHGVVAAPARGERRPRRTAGSTTSRGTHRGHPPPHRQER